MKLTAVTGMIDRAARQVIISLIRAYRRVISPLLPPACRFVPSCSEYGATAIERHGLVRGMLLALRRLLRCQPFSHGGFDPVP